MIKNSLVAIILIINFFNFGNSLILSPLKFVARLNSTFPILSFFPHCIYIELLKPTQNYTNIFIFVQFGAKLIWKVKLDSRLGLYQQVFYDKEFFFDIVNLKSKFFRIRLEIQHEFKAIFQGKPLLVLYEIPDVTLPHVILAEKIIYYDHISFQFHLDISVNKLKLTGEYQVKCIIPIEKVEPLLIQFISIKATKEFKSTTKSELVNGVSRNYISTGVLNQPHYLFTCNLFLNSNYYVLYPVSDQTGGLFANYYQMIIAVLTTVFLTVIIIIATYCFFVRPFSVNDVKDLSSSTVSDVSLKDLQLSIDGF